MYMLFYCGDLAEDADSELTEKVGKLSLKFKKNRLYFL
jgi:hypothetical protein